MLAMKTPLHDIETLAGSLETELKTAELHKSNDFYGFASVLKKYAGMPQSYQIKAAIEHGPLMGDCIWDQDIQAPLPAIFPMSRCRCIFLTKKSHKPVIPIGPVITYVDGYLTPEELRAEKQKLGKTLLAFPAHSTHWIDVEYDIEAYCNFLETLGKGFDTIAVCVYWKDVLRNIATHYRKRGFYCITAGHMFDPLFMPRLRSIIEFADLTTSNEISSVLGYCILLGKPHYYHRVHTTWKAPSEDILIRDTCGGKGARPFFRWIFDLFKEPRDDITDRQRDVVSYYWGYYDSKTPKEMALLFQLTEEMYHQKFSHRRDFTSLSKSITGADISLYSSLFLEKPAQRRAKEKTNSLKESDVLIASYPRSGNTWMRLLLADVILQYHGFKTDTTLPIHEDYIIPELPTVNMLDPRIRLPFRLIKSHDTYNPIIKKAVYIFRNPQDALCSYYHFHRRYPRLQAETMYGIDVFCLRRLAGWIKHVDSYIAAKRRGDADILFVSYESLHADPVCVLMETARFLDLPVTETMCKRAVENHSFEKQRGTETLDENHQEPFFRKKIVGSGRGELSKEAFARIQTEASRSYQIAFSLQPVAFQEIASLQKTSCGPISESSDDTIELKGTTRACSLAKVKLLNLGCGSRYHPDWVNVDVRSNGNGVIVHDLKKPLPFDEATFDAVYHSHLLEHFPKEYAPEFLKECFRVLKPGGIIRVVVPDLEQIARLYLQCLEQSLHGDAEAQKRYEWIVLELFDQMVRNRSGGAMLEYWRQQPMPAEDFVFKRMGSEVRTFLKNMYRQKEKNEGNGGGCHQRAELSPEEIGRFRLSGEVHQWMYDRYSLGKLLREAGFEDIRVCRADESAIPDFNSYLLDIEPEGSVRKPDSLFMEGRKPAIISAREESTTCFGTQNRSENVSAFL